MVRIYVSSSNRNVFYQSFIRNLKRLKNDIGDKKFNVHGSNDSLDTNRCAKYMDECDYFILLLPAQNANYVELDYAIAKNKPIGVVLNGDLTFNPCTWLPLAKAVIIKPECFSMLQYLQILEIMLPYAQED